MVQKPLSQNGEPDEKGAVVERNNTTDSASVEDEEDTDTADHPNKGPEAEGAAPDDLALAGGNRAEHETDLQHLNLESTGVINVVIARGGLNLRAGPGTEFPVIRSIPFQTRLWVLKREGKWALVDQAGDGAADGHVHLSFLREEHSGQVTGVTDTRRSGETFIPLDRTILQIIMDRCAGIRIRSGLDLDVVADALNRAMLLAEASNRLREAAFLSQSVYRNRLLPHIP